MTKTQWSNCHSCISNRWSSTARQSMLRSRTAYWDEIHVYIRCCRKTAISSLIHGEYKSKMLDPPNKQLNIASGHRLTISFALSRPQPSPNDAKSSKFDKALCIEWSFSVLHSVKFSVWWRSSVCFQVLCAVFPVCAVCCVLCKEQWSGA